MRPRGLEECLGQEHLLAEGKSLGDAIRRGDVGSAILWGPPGSGKTTLAGLVAQHTDRRFVAFSAVTEGVPRVREIIKEAKEHRFAGVGTILFCDEIHRFNKAQQDAFLPHVEAGVVTLIGATTENPSFELNGALLSRCQVYVLQPLDPEHLVALARRALKDVDRGLGGLELTSDDEAIKTAAEQSDGDARRLLTVMEAAANQVGSAGHLTRDLIIDVLARRVPVYDKAGEEHFNVVSALHKAIRGSDPQGALYWLARMIEGGEDPSYIARRLVRMASEDIGLADHRAMEVALAAKDAYHFLGSPEGELALAEAAVYLATAPKSNRIYTAWKAALEAARETPGAPVPLHIRNAPTKLMKELGYGKGYRYAHDDPKGFVAQEYLPEQLQGRRFYDPGPMGFEKRIAERLEFWNGIESGGSGDRGGRGQ